MQALLVGLSAGVAAALLFVAPLSATPLAIPLFVLTGLPVAIAGFGWGNLAALLAAVAGGITVLGFASTGGALIFTFLFGVPVAWATVVATQPTTTPDGRGWRPVGVVLTHTAVAVAIGLIAIGALVGYDPAELTRALTDALIEWGTTAGADTGRVPTASDVEPFVSLNVALLPVASGIFGVTMAAIDLYLGYKSVMLSERFRRPAESLSSIALPIGVPAALVVAAALALVPGALGHAAGVLAGALAAAVAMVGLAVVHILTRGLNWRGLLLAALYALLVVLSGLPLILLTLLGLAESAFHIRARRLKPSGPAQT